MTKLRDLTSVKKEPDLRHAIENQLLSSITQRTIILTEKNIRDILQTLSNKNTSVPKKTIDAFFDYFTWLDAQITKTEQEKNA